jgi:Ras-related protein Rab-7A
MNRFARGTFTGQYKATIGADFFTKDVVVTDVYGQRHVVTLQIWDTAGQERFQSLGVGFYRGSDGALLVYDVTDPASLDHLAHWQTEFLHHVGGPLAAMGGLAGGSSGMDVPFPFVVVGNKSDKAATDRKVPLARAEEWCRQHATLPGAALGARPLTHVEASAKTEYNVEEAFQEVARLALQYEDYRQRSTPQLFVPPAHVPIDLRHQQSSMSSSQQGDNCC